MRVNERARGLVAGSFQISRNWGFSRMRGLVAGLNDTSKSNVSISRAPWMFCWMANARSWEVIDGDGVEWGWRT